MKARRLLKRLAKEGAFDLHYRARFSPEIWVRDQAIGVEPYGETVWDVTEEILAMPPHWRQQALQGSSFAADELVLSKNAPDWVKKWARHDPYEVSVEVSRGQSGEWTPAVDLSVE